MQYQIIQSVQLKKLMTYQFCSVQRIRFYNKIKGKKVKFYS